MQSPLLTPNFLIPLFSSLFHFLNKLICTLLLVLSMILRIPSLRRRESAGPSDRTPRLELLPPLSLQHPAEAERVKVSGDHG